MKPVSVSELERASRTIESEIRRLERRGMHMTPPEVERATQLKWQRVLMKDRLRELRRV